MDVKTPMHGSRDPVQNEKAPLITIHDSEDEAIVEKNLINTMIQTSPKNSQNNIVAFPIKLEPTDDFDQLRPKSAFEDSPQTKSLIGEKRKFHDSEVNVDYDELLQIVDLGKAKKRAKRALIEA